MQETQFQSMFEKLANLRGLTAKSTGTIVDVEVDYSAVVLFIDTQYNYLVTVYEEEVGVSNTISLEQFRTVMMACLAKRVQYVRMKTNGIREGSTIQVDNTTRIPGPLFELFYSFGRVVSDSMGTTFLPAMGELLRQNVTVDMMRSYYMLVSKLKHYYAFSEGMPTQVDGSWAYLLYVDVGVIGATVVGPTKEARPSDAFLAASVRCARLVAGFPYNVTYGTLPQPGALLVQLMDACAKGIGDGK